MEKKFIEFLKSRRLKKTPERLEILHCCLECKGHFDVDILYNILDSRGYHVSKATIYSSLDLLAEAGIVRKLLFDTHQAKYEIAGTSHSHLICTQCGEIVELNIEGLDLIMDKLQLCGFIPNYLSTCIYGRCKNCTEKMRSLQ